MLGMMRRSSALMAAALMAMTAPVAPAPSARARIVHVAAEAAKPGSRGLFNDAILPASSTRYGRKGAGVSMAQQKRTAAKKRGIARNRRNHS